jgi:hypothetical protein
MFMYICFMSKVFQFSDTIDIFLSLLINVSDTSNFAYRTHAIITRSLYIFYPLFGSQKRFFKEVFFRKFYPYVWLVFKSGF